MIGTLVLICPDGAQAGVELLIADHAYSFASGHVHQDSRTRRACATTQSKPRRRSSDRSLMFIADSRLPRSAQPVRPTAIDVGRLHSYLERWSALDDQLVSRLGDGGVSCFGVGEAAGLLRAYAPRSWQRVRSCTADEVTGSSRFGLVPVVPLDQLGSDDQLLLGVRPRDQPGLVERFSPRFARVISWHDLIEV